MTRRAAPCAPPRGRTGRARPRRAALTTSKCITPRAGSSRGGAWAVFAPGRGTFVVLAILLWLTFLTGFVGLGMHLRGLGRQMGGLYVALFNWLEGPPAFAPALFTGLAAVGLVAIHLL